MSNTVKSGLPDPDKSGGGKTVGLPTKDSIMEYLTVDTAVDLKKNEIEDLDKVIKVMTMTPDLTFEALISPGTPTGRALRRAMAFKRLHETSQKHRNIFNSTRSRSELD